MIFFELLKAVKILRIAEEPQKLGFGIGILKDFFSDSIYFNDFKKKPKISLSG